MAESPVGVSGRSRWSWKAFLYTFIQKGDQKLRIWMKRYKKENMHLCVINWPIVLSERDVIIVTFRPNNTNWCTCLQYRSKCRALLSTCSFVGVSVANLCISDVFCGCCVLTSVSTYLWGGGCPLRSYACIRQCLCIIGPLFFIVSLLTAWTDLRHQCHFNSGLIIRVPGCQKLKMTA